ncbi:MAG TPA: peptidoglycan DD-metalloendopeptidase family protein [Candidatus Competibacteraceae bacterium]|nr:peptidoglycan DD-metalloendopeptidase family protein [Candidatus Competibacteraceae bacterium]
MSYQLSPAFEHYRQRAAQGLEPVPSHTQVVAWLRAHRAEFAELIAGGRNAGKIVYDFGSDNAEIPFGGDSDPWTAASRMFAQFAAAGAVLGVGRYRERRACYNAPQFAAAGGEARSVHLGIDLFAPAGTPLYAPLAGRVHSYADNALPLDYGPTIILEHQPEPGLRFYTLYGHLARESLAGLEVDQPFSAGAELARIGDPAVNGGWIPHVHFQIILDLLGCRGDFPGAGQPSLWALWESLCPDPNLILGLPEAVAA